MNEEQNCFGRSSLDDQLGCLQAQLLDSQKALQDAESEVNERKSQIAVLKTFISDFDGIIATYKTALPGFLEQQDNYNKFCENEKSCLESILGESCATKVCEKVTETKNAIVSLEKGIKSHETELAVEKGKRDCCQQTLKKAKEKFEKWKDPKKLFESQFKSLDQLKKEIEKEHNEHHDTIAYYLLTCEDKFCKLLENGPKVYSLEEFKVKLNEFWIAYVEADSVFNAQDAKVKGLEKQLETEREQLETDKKELEARIRRKLNELADSSACSKKNTNTNSTDTCIGTY